MLYEVLLLSRVVVEEAELESLEAALDLAQVGHSKELYHLLMPWS